MFLAFDLVFARWLPGPPGDATVVALRLPWIALPLLGGLAGRWERLRAALPAIVVSFSVAWTWANDWVFFELGFGGTVLQAIFVLIASITAATFLPLTLGGRAAVLALQGAGHVALDLAWSQPRPVDVRLWTDAAILTAVAVQAVVYENFARSQQRGIRLRHALERSVEALDTSRRRAAESAAAVGRLAAGVAHEVNNPLAATKANLRWLVEEAGGGPEAERVEVLRDSLEAVERITRIVEDLRRQAASFQPGAASDPGDGKAEVGGKGT